MLLAADETEAQLCTGVPFYTHEVPKGDLQNLRRQCMISNYM